MYVGNDQAVSPKNRDDAMESPGHFIIIQSLVDNLKNHRFYISRVFFFSFTVGSKTQIGVKLRLG